MRIAFFGGTFDPPHCGHLTIAKAAADRLHLDKVLFAPVGMQPLKQGKPVTDFDDRIAMTRLATACDPRFEVSLADAPQPDGKPNYTIDTLQKVKATLAASDLLFCLLGADSFSILRKWRSASGLLFVCDFIVAARPGFGLDAAEASLPEGVQSTASHAREEYTTIALSNAQGSQSTLYLLTDIHEEISATNIRNHADEHALKSDVPNTVADYIQTHNLYR